ncbi:bifunctional 4-hydroxy-2-oxoglutarate aldolase/2-dehydro-3-deoxy-phosphogluconate aldolase [Thalassobacillus pellis]|uniref:bifunctional 4-hydroxy-2-oxoglutarate aldolase/2-dehydro-3-deoxy-phosphogluconate aldolase n=1 Tax=Thalassobacillus pellis TaxID=748008 RepID=UPI001960744F|nr:bifunctional 4-hydroxy-2-oxoglutarate aldolase/2-dehydro-3-deoxy-phosphogluconate aldolase [Thalassobacillus pellis]MBM7551713.1 2-dehydro-3-deoxyphosphogluconate aldolase/(4S)-4-hydroxy-2-oxoglutarate aldolase [Thalassobacillus pellis]
MRKSERIDKIYQSGVIAVIRRPAPEKIIPIAEALVSGGVHTLEITADSERVYDMIRDVKARFGDEALVGAGTVLDEVTAKQAIEAGSDFIFAPNFDRATVEMGNRYGAVTIPGVMTPTEIVQAYSAGADLVKVFPATAMGPSYIKDLKGPLGHIPMIPTGGVNLDNVETYVKNGAFAVGAGGSLLDKKLIQAEDFKGLENLAREFKEKVETARKG